LNIGGGLVQTIDYGFVDDQLAVVEIRAHGEIPCDRLAAALGEKYPSAGYTPGSRLISASGKLVMLTYLSRGSDCMASLTATSTTTVGQAANAAKKAAEAQADADAKARDKARAKQGL
jgi:hypothetical protein